MADSKTNLAGEYEIYEDEELFIYVFRSISQDDETEEESFHE